MKPRAWILGVGARTPVGDGTAESYASMRAGIARFQPTERHLCQSADPMDPNMESPAVAEVAGIDPRAQGEERLLQLALPALGEALRSSGLRRAELEAASLHLALPDHARAGSVSDPARFGRELLRRAALPAPVEQTASLEGHSGFAAALEVALARLDRRDEGPAIVVTVDSLVERGVLRALDAQGRLKCTRSPEGVIPGEAAAVVVLRTAIGPAGRAGAGARATVLALGRAEEPAPFGSDRACTGTGLTAALRAAASGLGTVPLQRRKIAPPQPNRNHTMYLLCDTPAIQIAITPMID